MPTPSFNINRYRPRAADHWRQGLGWIYAVGGGIAPARIPAAIVAPHFRGQSGAPVSQNDEMR
jgi:hypothetical protein